MITLVTISCVLASLAPVVSKRLSSNSVAIGGGTGGDVSISINCSDKFGNKCKLCTKNYCLVCLNQDIPTGKYLDYVNCAIKDCPAHCETCSEDGCKKCESTYYADSNKTCIACSSTWPGCTNCTSSGCSECPSGKTMASDNSQCCSNKSNCLVYNGSCKCTSCNTGYHPDSSGNCVACSSTWTGCSTCTASKCQTCSSGYTMSSGNTTCCANKDNCTAYNNSCSCTACETDYHVSSGSCALDDWCTSEYGLIRSGNLCVTQYNMGDHESLPIVSGIKIKSPGEAYASKSCYQGVTANATLCDSSNGGYSGCTRTVCDHEAANTICHSLVVNGHYFRLPTYEEAVTLETNSINKGNSGLMFCDEDSGKGSAACRYKDKCYSTTDCNPASIWLYLPKERNKKYSAIGLENGAWAYHNNIGYKNQLSVRCVSADGPKDAGCPVDSFWNGTKCVDCGLKWLGCSECTKNKCLGCGWSSDYNNGVCGCPNAFGITGCYTAGNFHKSKSFASALTKHCFACCDTYGNTDQIDTTYTYYYTGSKPDSVNDMDADYDWKYTASSDTYTNYTRYALYATCTPYSVGSCPNAGGITGCLSAYLETTDFSELNEGTDNTKSYSCHPSNNFSIPMLYCSKPCAGYTTDAKDVKCKYLNAGSTWKEVNMGSYASCVKK